MRADRELTSVELLQRLKRVCRAQLFCTLGAKRIRDGKLDILVRATEDISKGSEIVQSRDDINNRWLVRARPTILTPGLTDQPTLGKADRDIFKNTYFWLEGVS